MNIANRNRVARFALVLCAGAAAMSGIGCSGAGTAGGADESTDSVQQREVASVSGAGVTLTFYAVPGAEGRTAIAMLERGSAYAASSPVAALIAQGLTSQEIYLAFSPAGAVAPAQLVEAQADQAAAIGRTAEVRHATVDAPALVEKSLAACKAAFFTDISAFAGAGSGSWKAGPSAGGLVSTSGLSESLPETTGFIVMGGCSESTTASLALTGKTIPKWPGGVPSQLTFTAPPSTYGRWYLIHHVSIQGSCPPNPPPPGFCFPATFGAAYTIVGASSGAFDLVTGNWIPTPAPPPQ